MVSSPPMKMGVCHFSGPVGSAFSCGQWADFFIWRESQLGISLGGLQYQFPNQLANGGPTSVKVNLTNCHREVCRSLPLVMFLHLCENLIKMLCDNVGHVFIH